MSSQRFFSVEKIKKHFFKTCPKTGRIYGVRKDSSIQKVFFIGVGLASLIWFLIRVLPKPSRASYPCMQAAAPVAFTFVGFISTVFLSAFGIRKAMEYFKTNRIMVAFSFIALAVAGVLTNIAVQNIDSFAQTGLSNGRFTPIDQPNTPMGVADGIFPGRVSWVHDPLATSWDGTSNYWWSTANNNQTAISNMMVKAVNNIAGGATIAESWDLLFKNLNKKKAKGNVGYVAGEKIVIKINLNSNGSNHGTNNWLDASPQTVYALLDELVNSAGVAQADICIYDAIRNTGMDMVINYCRPTFPNVSYQNWGGWVANSITYSSPTVPSTDARRMPAKVVAADYMINMALLKRHSRLSNNWQDGDGQTGVTLCGKNHYGTIGAPYELHYQIQDWRGNMGVYNPIVDLMGSKYLGGNTVLYLLDGLYASDIHETNPQKWKMAPFNNDWPSSIFASTDQVAIESVGLDFLNAEWGLCANADNYLHEASQANNPPSKTNYRPDGVTLKSLGVHEHWNNATDKQYSRNLGTGTGIELYAMEISPNTAPEIITQPKSISLPLGLKATLTVTVSGQTPLTYLWKKDGVDIPNSNSASYSIASITNADVASYTVVVTNSLGTVTSDAATISIGVDPNLAMAKNVTTAPTIDGNLTEPIWQLAYTMEKAVVGVKNNTEQFDLYWDNQNLYVGVKVLDANIITNNAAGYQNDGVEIYLDMDNNDGTYDANDRQYTYVVNNTVITEKQNRTANIVFATKLITGGYTMEIALPWATIGVTPSTSAIYGFSIGINDADVTIRDNQVMWRGDENNWQSTTNFGDLILVNQNTTSITQTIALNQGWNLISINVAPSDNTLVNIFKVILPDVVEVKNADAFWRNGQSTTFNSLASIKGGDGYLVNMKSAGTLSVTGTPIPFSNFQIPAFSNWYLIGCPYQSATPFSQDFNATNCSVIKDFEGFWKPNGTTNSIQNLEPGKGYFLKK